MSEREMSTRETANVLAPPPVLFGGALVVGAILQLLFPVPLLSDRTVGIITGVVLFSLGFGLSAAVVREFRRADTAVSPLQSSRHLVVSGPYRFCRNPDYIGQTLIYLGIGSVLNSLWVLVLVVPVLFLVRSGVVRREERYLGTIFGAEYEEYKRRVRRWV